MFEQVLPGRGRVQLGVPVDCAIGGGGLGTLVLVLGVEDAIRKTGLDAVRGVVCARIEDAVGALDGVGGVQARPDGVVEEVGVGDDGVGEGEVREGELADLVAGWEGC